MEVLDKLHSFDADIRYMGLSDMQRAISTRDLDPAWPAAVVALLGDTSLEVQNLAIRIIGQMASMQPAELMNLILVSTAAATVRAVALKNVIQHSNLIPRETVQAVLSALRRDPLFETIEGSEAVYGIMGHATGPISFTDRMPEILDYTANLVSHPGLLRMRGFDILALCLPALSEDSWNASVKQLVLDSVTKVHDPAAIALVGKLAHHVSSRWLIPDLEDIVYINAEVPSDVDTCEAALESLASLYTVENFNKARADALSRQHIKYSEVENGNPDNSDASNDDMEWQGASDDSEWFDESSRVRKASAKLASKSSDPEMTRVVFNAAIVETDESARSAMYTALTNMRAVSQLNLPLDALTQRISKDIAQGNWTAADSGIKAIAKWDMQSLVARLVHEAAAKRPALLNRYIYLIHGPERTEDTRWILKRALHPDIAAVPETAIYALGLAVELDEPQVALDAARLTRSSNHSEPLKIAALNATGKLATPADWPEIIPLTLHNLRAEPSLRPAALTSLERAASSQIPEELARDIVFAVDEILNVSHEPSIVAKCCVVLASLPDSVAPEVVRTVMNLKDADFKEQKEEVLMSHAHVIQPDVLEWALTTESLKLLRFLSLKGDSQRVINEALSRTDTPEVHAAAAGALWRNLDSRYGFTTTEFSNLSSEQLRVLHALLENDIVWDWYTVEEMLSSNLDENATSKGSALGLMAVNSEAEVAFISRLPELNDKVRASSFEAYASHARDKQTVFELARDHPQLQIPSSLAVAITSAEELRLFLATFEDETAEFTIATLKLLHGPVLVDGLPALIGFLRDTSIDSSVRAEACMTISWILQTVGNASAVQYADAAMHAFAAALVPMSDQVQTLNIGPFKHRVDLNLPLRQAAIDGIYTCGLLSKLISYREIVDAVVDRGLRDDFEVKIVACRTITVLAEADPKAVQARWSTIKEIWDADLSKKLKENAMKEDVEKHMALVTTIQTARDKLASHM